MPPSRIKTRTIAEVEASIKAHTLPETEHQVIIHCIYKAGGEGMWIRIWPTTFLIDKTINHRSELVHVENIPMFPDWLQVAPNEKIQFSLIFTGLPASCLHFDLLEEIAEPGAFTFLNIPRNETDVYTVRFS
ncbi:MAG: hypothetical protein M3R25_05535 [Bacteroidota bacterium]|nr:hypothetical protein [Bacteroidota bacterium]